MRKRCKFCGRYFAPNSRTEETQKACKSDVCKTKRKREAQRRWSDNNPGYFKGRYDYVKEWRAKRKATSCSADKMIQDETRSSKSMKTYILLIPESKTGMIQDTIILRRLAGRTFVACG